MLSKQASILYGSPLKNPRIAKLTILFLAVLLAISTFQILPVLAQLDADATQLFFEALLWAALLTIIPLAILWFLDRREPESRWLYVIAILWGGLIAIGLALPLNLVRAY